MVQTSTPVNQSSINSFTNQTTIPTPQKSAPSTSNQTPAFQSSINPFTGQPVVPDVNKGVPVGGGGSSGSSSSANKPSEVSTPASNPVESPQPQSSPSAFNNTPAPVIPPSSEGFVGSYTDKYGIVHNYGFGEDISKVNNPNNVGVENGNAQPYKVYTASGQEVIRTNIVENGIPKGYYDVAVSSNLPVINDVPIPSVTNALVSTKALDLLTESKAFRVENGNFLLQNPNTLERFLFHQGLSLETEKGLLEVEKSKIQNEINQGLNPIDEISKFNAEVNSFNVKSEALNVVSHAFNLDIQGRNFATTLFNNQIAQHNALVELNNPANDLMKPTIPTGISGVNITQPFANPVTASTITNQELLTGVNPNLTSKGSPLFPLTPTEQVVSSAITIGAVAFITEGLGEFLVVPEAVGVNALTKLGVTSSTAIQGGELLSQASTGGLQAGSIAGISLLSGSSYKQSIDVAGYGLVSPVGKIAGITATKIGFTGLGSSTLALESSLITGGITTYNVEKDVGGFQTVQGKIALIGGSIITGLGGYNAYAETLDLNKALSKPNLNPQVNLNANSYEFSTSTSSSKYPGSLDVLATKQTTGSFEVKGEEALAVIKSTTTGSATVFKEPLVFVSEPSESGEILFPSGSKVKYYIPNTAVRGFQAQNNGEILNSVFTSETETPYKSGIARQLGVTEESIANTNIPVRSVSGFPIPNQLNEFTQEEFSNLLEIKGLSVSSSSKIYFEGIESSTGETTLGVSSSGVNLKGVSLAKSGKGLVQTPITVEENTIVENVGEGLDVSKEFKPSYQSFERSGKGFSNTPFEDIKDEFNIKVGSVGYNKFIAENPNAQFIFKSGSTTYGKFITSGSPIPKLPQNEGSVLNSESNNQIILSSNKGSQANLNSQGEEFIASLPEKQRIYLTPNRQVILSDISSSEEAFRTSFTRSNNVGFVSNIYSTSLLSSSSSSSNRIQQSSQISVKESSLLKTNYETSNLVSNQVEVLNTQNLQENLATNYKLENLTSTQQQLQQLQQLQELQQLQTQQLTQAQIQPFNPNIPIVPFDFPSLTKRGGVVVKTPKKQKTNPRSREQIRLAKVDFNYIDLLSRDASIYLTGKSTQQSYKQRRREFYNPGNTQGIILTKELKKYYKTQNKQRNFSVPKEKKLSLKEFSRSFKVPKVSGRIRGFNFGRRKSSRIL